MFVEHEYLRTKNAALEGKMVCNLGLLPIAQTVFGDSSSGSTADVVKVC